MFFDRPYLLLILLCFYVPSVFFITYLISVSYGDISAGFPYISDTGSKPPASCIFGQFLDIGAVISFGIFYVRYMHVKKILIHLKTTRIMLLNQIGFWIGILSCLGVTVVGNFQETNVVTVHLIGAILAFFGLLIYVWLQTFISNALPDFLYSTQRILAIRLFFCVLGTSNLVIVIVFSKIAEAKFNGNDRLLWKPEDGGYVEHVISTSNEWLMSIIICVVLSTFFKDFKKLKVLHADVKINPELDNGNLSSPSRLDKPFLLHQTT